MNAMVILSSVLLKAKLSKDFSRLTRASLSMEVILSAFPFLHLLTVNGFAQVTLTIPFFVSTLRPRPSQRFSTPPFHTLLHGVLTSWLEVTMEKFISMSKLVTASKDSIILRMKE
jgi:hypothetical protein